MENLIKKLSSRPVPSGCTNNTVPYVYTEQNIAVTPSQIQQMVERGIPVSPSNASSFIDGVPNPSFDVPIEHRRGVDVVDVWDASQDAKRSLIQAHLKDKSNYE